MNDVQQDLPDLAWAKLPDEPGDALQVLIDVFYAGLASGVASVMATAHANIAGNPGPADLARISAHAQHQVTHMSEDPAAAASVEEAVRHVVSDHCAACCDCQATRGYLRVNGHDEGGH